MKTNFRPKLKFQIISCALSFLITSACSDDSFIPPVSTSEVGAGQGAEITPVEVDKAKPDLKPFLSKIKDLNAKYESDSLELNLRRSQVNRDLLQFFHYMHLLADMLQVVAGEEGLEIKTLVDQELMSIGEISVARDIGVRTEVASINLIQLISHSPVLQKSEEAEAFLLSSPIGLNLQKNTPFSEVVSQFLNGGFSWLAILQKDANDYAAIAPFVSLTTGIFAKVFNDEFPNVDLNLVFEENKKVVEGSAGYFLLGNVLYGRTELFLAMIQDWDAQWVEQKKQEIKSWHDEGHWGPAYVSYSSRQQNEVFKKLLSVFIAKYGNSNE